MLQDFAKEGYFEEGKNPEVSFCSLTRCLGSQETRS